MVKPAWPHNGASLASSLAPWWSQRNQLIRLSTTALALVIGVWGLERPENDPVDHFQRKAGRQALEKPANKHFVNSSRFALLAAFPTVNLRFQLTRRKRPMDRTSEKKIMPALWQAMQS